MVCWVTACANYSGKGKRPKIEDFMPEFDDEKNTARSPEAMRTVLKAAASAMKGSA